MNLLNLRKKYLLYLIIIFSLFYITGIITHKPYFIGPPDSTQWAYTNQGTPASIGIAFLIGFAVIVLYYFFSKRIKISFRNEIIFLVLVVILNILFLLSIINITEGGLTNVYGIIHSPNAAGYFTEASKLKFPSSLLSNYSKKMHALAQHARNHPPGAILVSWKINNLLLGYNKFNEYISNKFMKDNAHVSLGLLTARKRAGLFIWSIIVTLLTALTPIAIYLFSRFMYGYKNAMLASALWLLIPSPLLFYSNLDSVYALFSILIIYFFYRSLFSENILWLLLAGIVLSISLFFTYAFLFFILLFFIVYLFMLLTKKITIPSLTKKGLLILIPVLIFYSVLFLKYNFNCIQTFLEIKNFVTGDLMTFRPYFTWIFFNILEFIEFLGIPIIFLFAKKAYDLTKSKTNTKKIFLLSYLVVMLFFNFSGTALGEVARVWIFLMPVFVIFAGKKLTELKNKKLIYLVMFIQLIIIIVQKVNLRLVDI